MGEKKKRFLSILLAFIMIGTMIPVQVYAQKTGTEVKKFNNIVLFVQFAEITPEDPGTNFMNTVPESYANTTYQKDALSFWSNDSSTPKTLKNYLNAVSYGQFEVNNVLPQYDAATGVITPYVVDPSLQTNEIGLIQACMG
ncbi:MAG: hypothetical protein EOM18_12435, partial [Clostridia bacterium]|nr:hypothetical protein [Clostridia bacterium]